MGLLAKLTQRVAPIALRFGGLIPGPVGAAAKALGPLAARLGKKAPAIIAAGGAFGVAETLGSRAVGGYTTKPSMASRAAAREMYGEPGTRRKRRAGLTGRDILGAQKVARLVHAFGYKPKIKPRKSRRR